MQLPPNLPRVPRVPVVDCAVLDAPDVVREATTALFEAGVVKLRRAFDPRHVLAWKAQFEEATLGAQRRGQYCYRLWGLGEGRRHYIVEIHRAFNDPAFYANRYLYNLAMATLDRDFVLATAAVAYAEPGAGMQYIHRDQTLLFSNPTLNSVLPPISLTVAVPLVPTGDEIGGTEFVPGSHRLAELPLGATFQHVDTDIGDCVLWDSRLQHRGRANPASVARPLVLLYYQRPWYFNFRNYEQDCEIKITRDNLARVPERHRHLFDWCHRLFVPPEFGANTDGSCGCGSGLAFEACHGAAA